MTVRATKAMYVMCHLLTDWGARGIGTGPSDLSHIGVVVCDREGEMSVGPSRE